jgi:nicotinate-nucleotide adenylyltransferase
MKTEDLQNQIDKTYTSIFGRTPLAQRLKDISKESIELQRFLDLKSLKEESGDLLTTLIQLLNECGWTIEELVKENLKKIEKRKIQYKGLGRKTQVAILGGAFDPITTGHIAVAKLVLDHSSTFDEVWLMPCYKHLYNKHVIHPTHRLNMCSLAAEIDGRIKVFDYEIKNKLHGETYNLIKRLLNDKISSNHNFSFVIGLDNANTFDKWVNYEDLEKLVRFVIVPRTGEKQIKKVNWYKNTPHIFIEPDEPLIEISSTLIRNDLHKRHSMQLGEVDTSLAYYRGLDPKVKNYIFINDLYRG